MNVLTGSVEHFAMPDVFRLVAHNKLTGALRVSRASGDATVFFNDGEVLFALSSLTREFLGRRLVNAKLITEGQLLRMLDEQKKASEKRIGDLLVEKGFISKDLLDSFLKEQVQDAIFGMLQWDVGTFEFNSGEAAPQDAGLAVSVENLIMESSRRIQEWDVIRRKIPSLEVVVTMSPAPPAGVVEINIQPEEWTLLVLADGTRTLRDISAASEKSEFEVCRIIYGLVTAGLLDVASGAHESHEMPSVVALPAVDAPRKLKGGRKAKSRTLEPADLNGDEGSAEVEPAVVLAEERVARQAEAVPGGPGGPGEPGEPEAEMPAAAEASEPEPTSAKRKAADPTVSKEMLLRLIAGVRNL